MRVKRGFTRKRAHKKVLARTKGFRMTKNRLYKVAREADLHAGQYAYVGRKNRKRDFRRLWISRINAALGSLDLKYSLFMSGLKKAKIEINRKNLSQLALDNPKVFEKIVTLAKKDLDK